MKKIETRKIDKLGRIVLPLAMRESLNIIQGDLIDMELEADAIIIKKNEPACLLCGSQTNLKQYHEHFSFCQTCIKRLANL